MTIGMSFLLPDEIARELYQTQVPSSLVSGTQFGRKLYQSFVSGARSTYSVVDEDLNYMLRLIL